MDRKWGCLRNRGMLLVGQSAQGRWAKRTTSLTTSPTSSKTRWRAQSSCNVALHRALSWSVTPNWQFRLRTMLFWRLGLSSMHLPRMSLRSSHKRAWITEQLSNSSASTTTVATAASAPRQPKSNVRPRRHRIILRRPQVKWQGYAHSA